MKEDELAVDRDRAAQEVDPIDGEAEALALAHAGAGGEEHDRPVALGQLVGDCLDLLDGRRFDLRLGLAGESRALRRVADDQVIGDGVVQDRREQSVDHLDRRWGQHLGPAADPRLDLAGAQRGQRPVTERGEDVVAQVSVDLNHGAWPVELGGLPGGGVVPQEHLAGAGVDVGPVEQLALDLGEEPLRVGPAVEVLHPLRAARVEPVPGPPAPVGSTIDAGHPASRSRALRRWVTGRPARSSQHVGPGHRRPRPDRHYRAPVTFRGWTTSRSSHTSRSAGR